MIPLILSIGSSTLIFVIFKLFKKFQIDTMQALVVNYLAASLIGFGLYNEEWKESNLLDYSWIYYALITSFFFIGLFFIMAKSSQENGVASTSIAVKMSMAFSLSIMLIFYSEELSILKLTGILLAILGVYLVSSSTRSNTKTSPQLITLFILFMGSGLLDFALNYIQKYQLGTLSPSLFTAFSLGMAGVIGCLIILIKFIQGKIKIQSRNIIAGLILAIPNYFSIYLLLLSYRSTGWTDTTVLAITNVSVVLLSAIIGFIIFRENASKRKLIGLLSALIAIATLYIAN